MCCRQTLPWDYFTFARNSGAIQMLDQSFQSHANLAPFGPKFAQTLGVALRLAPNGISEADQNKAQSTMKRSSLALVAVTLLAAVGMSPQSGPNAEPSSESSAHSIR